MILLKIMSRTRGYFGAQVP